MSHLVTIQDTQLEQLLYHDIPVVTFQQIADVHGISVQNVFSSFRRHKERFTEGKHFYLVENAVEYLGHNGTLKTIYLFTEKGYLLLTKPLRDAKAWEVQERMVDDYFAMKQAQAPTLPQLHDPTAQALMQLLIDHDATKYRLACLEAAQLEQKDGLIAQQAQTIEALMQATRAETKADLALEDAHYMTLEDCIVKNGLLRQFPVSQWSSYTTWLKQYCLQYVLEIRKNPVVGKLWPDENAYPIPALAALIRYEQRKPRQLAMVSRATGGSTHD